MRVPRAGGISLRYIRGIQLVLVIYQDSDQNDGREEKEQHREAPSINERSIRPERRSRRDGRTPHQALREAAPRQTMHRACFRCRLDFFERSFDRTYPKALPVVPFLNGTPLSRPCRLIALERRGALRTR